MAVRLLPVSREAGELADCADGYPALFRIYVLRSVEAALLECRSRAAGLSAATRERSLHALSFALKIPDYWPPARDLLLMLAPSMEDQPDRNAWQDYLHRGAELAESHSDRAAGAQAYLHLGRLALINGEYVVAEAQLEQALRLSERFGEMPATGRVLGRLAYRAAARSDFIKLRKVAQVVLVTLDGHDPSRAPVYQTLGYSALLEGNWKTAIEHFRNALTARREDMMLWGEAQALCDDELSLFALGEVNTVAETLHEAIRLFGLASDGFNQAAARMNLGIVFWCMGRNDESLECYRMSELAFVEADSSLQLARLHNNRGLTLCELGRYDEALQNFSASEGWARRNDHHLEVANVLDSLGEFYLLRQQRADAANVWQAALRELDKLPEKPADLRQEIVRKINELADIDSIYRVDFAYT